MRYLFFFAVTFLSIAPVALWAQSGNARNNEAAPVVSSQTVNTTRLFTHNVPLTYGSFDAWTRVATNESQLSDPQTDGKLTNVRTQSFFPRQYAERTRLATPTDASVGNGPFERFSTVGDARLTSASASLAMASMSAAMRDVGAPAGYYTQIVVSRARAEQGIGDWRRTGWSARDVVVPRADWYLARPFGGSATPEGIRPIVHPAVSACQAQGCLMLSSHQYVRIVNGNTPIVDASVRYDATETLTSSTDSATSRAFAIYGLQAAYLRGLWSAPGRGVGDFYPATIAGASNADMAVALAISASQTIVTASAQNVATGFDLVNGRSLPSLSGVGANIGLYGSISVTPFATLATHHQSVNGVLGWTTNDTAVRSAISR